MHICRKARIPGKGWVRVIDKKNLKRKVGECVMVCVVQPRDALQKLKLKKLRRRS